MLALWLNRTRIHRHAQILAVLTWGIYGVMVATPGLRDRSGNLKGTDFLHAYVLGSLALEHRGDALYDAQAQAAESVRRVPASAGDYFLPTYGPQVALFFAPFARLPYGWAALLWMCLSALAYAVCCRSAWRQSSALAAHGAIVCWVAIGFTGFFNLIGHGQNSAIALCSFMGAYEALRRRRHFVAGLCLGVLAYKPQLGLVAGMVFLCALDWRVMVGALVTAAAQLGAAALYFGRQALVDYVNNLRGFGRISHLLEPKPFQLHSLRGFFNLLLPWRGVSLVLYGVTALAVTVVAVRTWRRSALPLEIRFAVLLVATVLVSPHLTVYDLVLLAPALIWAADASLRQDDPRLQWLVYAGFVLPLLGPVAQYTHVQLSVLSFAGLAVELGRKVS